MRQGAGGTRDQEGFRNDRPVRPKHQAELGGRCGHEKKRKPPHPRSVLDLVDPQLHGHVEAVQNVSAEHQRVYGGVDCMDPAWGGEGTERVSHWPFGAPHYAHMQEGAGGPGEHPGPEGGCLGRLMPRAELLEGLEDPDPQPHRLLLAVTPG